MPKDAACVADVDGSKCGRPVVAKELCATHYQQLRRTGDPVPSERIEVADVIPLRMDGPLSRAVRAQAKKEEVGVAEWIRGAAREKLAKKSPRRPK